MARSSSGFAGQAARNALLKYAPQREALQEALQTAQQTYGSTVKASRANARLTKGAINEAIPATRDIYKRADAAQQPGVTLLSSLLGSLHGVSDAQKGGNAAEVQQQLANLISQRSGAESRLQREGVAAQAGAQFAESSARGSLQNTIANLVSKNGRLSAQQGAAASAEADNLANQALDREQREAASIRSSNTSTANNERTTAASEGKTPGASGKLKLPPGYHTATGHGQFREKIETVRNEAWHLLSEHRHDRGYVQKLLEEDVPATSGTSKAGNKYSEPAKAGVRNAPLLQAALDLAQYGGLTKGTIKLLHEAKYSVKTLGYPAYRAQPKGLTSPAHTGR